MDKVAAAKAVNKLVQPEGMHAPTWERMKKVLKALCRYLPSPYPGMRRLAKDTRLPLRTVCRLLAQAVDLELLVRTSREIPGHRDGYTYRLAFLDALQYVPVSVPVSDQTGTEEELRSSSRTTYSKRSSGRRPAAAAPPQRRRNRWSGDCVVCGHIVRAKEGFLHGHHPVHDFCDSGTTDEEKLREYLMDKRWQLDHQRDFQGPQAYGTDPDEPQPVHTVRHSTPAQRLAGVFEDHWREVVRKNPEWKRRCMNKGAAIRYLNTTFLGQDYSPEHVEAYFDAFFEELTYPHSELFMTDNQTPWQLFTGWWGSVTVPDPAIARQKREFLASVRAEAEAQSVVERAAKAAAWERIEAAEANGEQPTEEDIKLVTGHKVLRRR